MRAVRLFAIAAAASFLSHPVAEAADVQPIKKPKPRIQVAVLLDTSNSMDGLIDQARSQLWKIVNEFAVCKRGGVRPEIEVALYEYGKQSLPASENFIRQILPLTTDLDKISEELFALRTNGGEEYCGAVIERAVNELRWSADPRDLKVILIAGNEPFAQGPVDYRKSCRNAIARGIVVNTIHCGNVTPGEESGWREGATLADGSYTHIDHNKALVSITAPQDERIVKLGVELNATYVAYGKSGEEGKMRQSAQDWNTANLAAAKESVVQRQLFKCADNYNCSSWDLVDAVKEGKVKLADLKPNDLPEEMRKLNLKECQAYLDAKAKKRAEIQSAIAKLNVERQKFIDAELKKRASESDATLDSAVIATVRSQAVKKEFVFEKK